MTTSRTSYQNNYPSSSASVVSTDMHASWHAAPYSSHISSNGINGLNANRSRPLPPPPPPSPTTPTSSAGTTVTNGHVPPLRTSHHDKADFYKNGRPTEVIVIDSQSPDPPPQQSTTKRKRQDSISASTTVSAVTKRARKSLNDEIALSATSGSHNASARHASKQRAHTVTWIKDEHGVYRAQNVIVPKIEEVWTHSSPFLSLSLWTGLEWIGSGTGIFFRFLFDPIAFYYESY